MLNIKILGIGCRKSKALKAELEEAINQLSISVRVEEVTLVEKILTYNILATPALIINGQVACQGIVPEVSELKTLLQRSEAAPVEVNSILVPTDFSEVSSNAFRFANRMAEEKKVTEKLVHVVAPSLDEASLLQVSHSEDLFELKKELLDKFVENNISPKDGSIVTKKEIDQEVVIGFAAEEIIKLSKEQDLIVMGTRREESTINKVLGSVSSVVAQNAECPVLLIPGGATYNGFKKVLYAGNYEARDQQMLSRLSQLAGPSLEAIHYAHFYRKKEVNHIDYKLSLAENFPDEHPGIDLQFVNLTGKEFWKEVGDYASGNNIDLIVMGTYHRKFAERIFHKSMTKKMVFETSFPLLVLYFDR